MKDFRVDLDVYEKKNGRFLGRSLTEFHVNRTSDLCDRNGILHDHILRLCVARTGVEFKPAEYVFDVIVEEIGGRECPPLGLWAC